MPPAQRADFIVSKPHSCIVGYQSVSVNSGDTITLAVQFTDVDGSNLAVSKLVTVGAPAGASSANVGADQIWTYNPTSNWVQ